MLDGHSFPALTRRSDFDRWIGHEAKIELDHPFNGRKRFRGMIRGSQGEELLFELPDAKEGEDKLVRLPLGDIGEAHLVLTDELIREALRREKSPVPSAGEAEPPSSAAAGKPGDRLRSGVSARLVAGHPDPIARPGEAARASRREKNPKRPWQPRLKRKSNSMEE